MTNIKENKEKTTNSFSAPVAIVIAGALIAAAVFFSGNKLGTTETVSLNENGKKPADLATDTNKPKLPASAVGEIRPVTEEDHIKGTADAKVTIIEYSDLECPFCKKFHPTMQKIVQEYPNDVRWVYRHFPLEQLHGKAMKEAEATECAGEQNKFWEMTDKIYEVTPSNDGLDLSSLPTLAQQAGVPNITQFESCLENGKYEEKVRDDLADAKSAGGRGTPYNVILSRNGQKTSLSGARPYEAVKQAVDQALNEEN